LITTLSLYLLLSLKRTPFSLKKSSPIILGYFIPSIFFWTSTGLREAFIMAEIVAFVVGFSRLLEGKRLSSYVLLFIGSYGLLSTKYYLWGVLALASILTVFFMILTKNKFMTVFKFSTYGILLPLVIFFATSTSYSFSFMSSADIDATSKRTGDSIIQVSVDQFGNALSDPNSNSNPSLSPNSNEKVITFHGDMTLVLLRSYLIENKNSNLSRIFDLLGFDEKIEEIWNEKIKLGLVSESNKVGRETSSLNGHILEPGNIQNPISLAIPAFIFLFGPFPFIGDPGLAVGVASLESPFWWLLYLLVIISFVKNRKFVDFKDSSYFLASVFLVGEILMSALVEVNLGTSFRHRSILLAPLIYLLAKSMTKTEHDRKQM